MAASRKSSALSVGAPTTARARQSGRGRRDDVRAKLSQAPSGPDQAGGIPDAARMLTVEVIWSNLAAVTSDVILVGHYSGVLPQHSELALDELVSDTVAGGARKLVISEMSQRGAIRGDLGEVTLFPAADHRLAAVAGMGRPGTFGTAQLRRLARTVAQVIGVLPRHNSLASVAIGSGEGNNIAVPDAALVFLGGLIEALDADSSLRISRMTFIEKRLDRALDILQALKNGSDELNRRRASRKSLVIDITNDLIEHDTGEIPSDFGCAMLLAALGMPSESEAEAKVEKHLLDTLLARLPASVHEAVRERLRPRQDGASLAKATLRDQAMRFRLNESRRAAADKPVPVRVTLSRSGEDIRATAITNTTTVTERILQRRAGLAEHASERLYKPSHADFETHARRLRRLIVHADIRDVLDRTDPLVVEVDYSMALVPWEMLPVGQDAEPLGVHRAVARQLRTYYSPRPFDLPRPTQRKALVVGDPAAGPYALEAARHEAETVQALLEKLGVSCTALIGPPEDGTGAGSFKSYLPADYFEVVDLLLSGEFDIVHFSGHAVFDPDKADRSGWVFKDRVLTASDLEGMERPPRLVFANACLSAQLGQPQLPQTTEPPRWSIVAGLADQFFRQGVRDYIGAAWEVPSEPAAEFASTVYKSLLGKGVAPSGRVSLGEALQLARKSLYERNHDLDDENWSVWGAYQHYGDPTTLFED